MDVKTCKQCGELKPITQYRRYYGGRKGTYTMCKQCERINSREKYLTAKGESMTWQEEAELEKIHKLYEYQRSMGLQPPNKQVRRASLADELDSMLDKYNGMSQQITAAAPPFISQNTVEAPHELLNWLTAPLDQEPDYYLDEVYERLRDTYRPCVGIDKASMMPVYDEKYKAILDRILDRFNDYEDSYYEGIDS